MYICFIVLKVMEVWRSISHLFVFLIERGTSRTGHRDNQPQILIWNHQSTPDRCFGLVGGNSTVINFWNECFQRIMRRYTHLKKTNKQQESGFVQNGRKGTNIRHLFFTLKVKKCLVRRLPARNNSVFQLYPTTEFHKLTQVSRPFIGKF